MDSVDLMGSPGMWPLRVLPVKRVAARAGPLHGDLYEAGYLEAGARGRPGRVEPVVYVERTEAKLGRDAFRYASFEDLLAAGWEID